LNNVVFIMFGYLMGILFLYDAYRIQRLQGVVTESRVAAILLLFATIVQFFTLDRFSMPPLLFYSVTFGVLLIGWVLKLYYGGRVISVHDATKVSVISFIEKELTRLSVPYEKKEGLDAEKVVFNCLDNGARITVTTGFFGSEERKVVKVTFVRWWCSSDVEEIQYRLLELYRQQRQSTVFWKEIITNCTFATIALGASLYFTWSFLQSSPL